MALYTIFMVLICIASVLLIIVIMAQNPKGGGLSGTFGGTNAASFGVQRTNDFMENTTKVLAGSIVVLIFLAVTMTAKPSRTPVPLPQNQKTLPTKKLPNAPQAPNQRLPEPANKLPNP